MKLITLAAGMLLLVFTLAPVRAVSEIAVAMHYLQAGGVSHSQLYLYREDGTLLRQLTKEKLGQVKSPVFAPDGKTIVFNVQKGKETEYWSVEPKGGNLRKLGAAPVWFAESKGAPCFVYPASDEELDGMLKTPLRFVTPDGTQELVLVHNTEDEQKQSDYDQWQYGKHFQVCDLKTGKMTEAGGMAGFFGLYGVLHLGDEPKAVFLIEPPMRVAFFFMHLDSTEGDTVLALDLDHLCFTCLSPNWATPFPLPGEAGFLTLTENRYVSIPHSEKTANSSYVEHWDSNFKKVRYGSDAAAVCYGASMYRPGGKPSVVTIPDPE